MHFKAILTWKDLFREVRTREKTINTPMYAGLLWLASHNNSRYDDMYELYMTYTNGVTGRVQETFLVKSVANFFDENGYLCEEIFEEEVKKLHSSLLLEKKDN